MKNIRGFLRQYKLFGFAVISALIGLGLYILGHHLAAKWLVSSAALIATMPLLYGMVEDIRTGSYGIDILAATAIIVSVILGQYWAALVIVLMLTGGEALENYAEHRARRELDSLLRKAPQQAHLLKNRKTVTVRVSQLRIGDKIIIKPGELVPVDAVILDGSASMDESSLTGESLPIAKTVGDTLLSGSINSDGVLTAQAVASAADSQYQQIIKLVRSAAASQAPFVRLAERYSIPFTIAAFAIAGAVWAVTGQAIRFLEVIVVATPCPLLLAAPIALISGMSRASKFGIVVKTGSALERLAEAETVAFDKTGTLTSGRLTVTAVTTFNSFEKSEVVGLAASLEQNSNHVVAKAIVRYAAESKLAVSKAKHVKEIAGRGLLASLKGRQILVGRYNLLIDHGIAIPAKFKHSSITQTAVYVAVGTELAGVISFSDALRDNSANTLNRLKQLGLKNFLLVTGDNLAAATAVGKTLGIKAVHAEALPADKLRVIEAITARPVVFVGDGINDAPVLTAADVGIALGAGGSTAASESADIVILQDDISRVATAYAIAKRTFGIARQSILIGIGLSLLLMALFATGKFSPLTGALAQEVVDVIVIFNALRARTGNL
ncbi:MAG: heavy metal translocating P-type ATPase [Patescibacteria group bacterium]|nr:heavy metal translocating P-type ATPase [Patescibacteria group bacterium]